MQLSLRPSFRFDATAPWLPRLASLVLFIALCALATYWVLAFSAMRTIPVPQSARVAQTEAVETGAVATLFGGSAQGGPRDVQLLGVVAEVGGGAGAAIVSLDGGPAKAVRVGADLSPQIRLVEVRQRAVVIERNGVRQEIALPVQAGATRGPPGGPPRGPLRAAAALPTPPSGAAAPMATPVPPPAPATSPAAAGSQQPAQESQPQPQPVDPSQYQPVPAPQAVGEGQPAPKE